MEQTGCHGGASGAAFPVRYNCLIKEERQTPDPVRLTDKDVLEFKELYKQKFCEDLDWNEAYDKASKLVRMVQLAYQPMTVEEYKALQIRRKELGENEPTGKKWVLRFREVDRDGSDFTALAVIGRTRDVALKSLFGSRRASIHQPKCVPELSRFTELSTCRW